MPASTFDDKLDRRQIEILCDEVTRRAEAAYAALIELEQSRDVPPVLLRPEQQAYQAAFDRACTRYLSLWACRCRLCADPVGDATAQ